MAAIQHLALDANIIIEAFKLNAWKPLADKFNIVVTSTIIEEASFFIIDSKRISISKSEFGKCTQIDPNLQELQDIVDIFDNVLLQSVEQGEIEILALVKAGKLPEECRICTSDGPAVIAACLLEYGSFCVSFESLLRKIGFTKSLDYQFTEEFLTRKVTEGKQNRIQGVGLRKR
ncbi:MAG TPA: hypothetical protein VM054_06535 [bacterium]|nr:hypothetical protein [bacterium]